MTEDEAKTKWCPMVRAGAGYQGMVLSGINAVYYDRLEYVCIASACMMWRREKDDYAEGYGKDIPSDGGYCGLAGKPV